MVSKSGLPTLPTQYVCSNCACKTEFLCGGMHKDRVSSTDKKTLLDNLHVGIINVSLGTEIAPQHKCDLTKSVRGNSYFCNRLD